MSHFTGPYTGLQGGAKIGAATICINTWSVTEEADKINLTGSCAGGVKNIQPGLKTATGSFAGKITDQFPGAAVPGSPATAIKVGSIIDLELLYDVTSSLGFIDPQAWVVNFKIDWDYEGTDGVPISVDFQASTSYSWDLLATG